MRQRVAVQEPLGGIVEHAEYVAALPRVDQRRVAVLAERAVFADLVERVAVQVDAVRKRGVVARRDAGRPPPASGAGRTRYPNRFPPRTPGEGGKRKRETPATRRQRSERDQAAPGRRQGLERDTPPDPMSPRTRIALAERTGTASRPSNNPKTPPSITVCALSPYAPSGPGMRYPMPRSSRMYRGFRASSPSLRRSFVTAPRTACGSPGPCPRRGKSPQAVAPPGVARSGSGHGPAVSDEA